MSSKITFRTETTTINRPPRRPTKTGQQQKSISWFAHAPIVDQLSPIPNLFSDLYIHSTVNANLGPSKQTLGTEWSIPISHIMFQLHTLCMCEKFLHIMCQPVLVLSHLTNNLWLAFLAHVQQARKSSGTRFHSSQQHKYALPCLPEIFWKPPKQQHLFTQDTLDGTNGVRIIEVPM